MASSLQHFRRKIGHAAAKRVPYAGLLSEPKVCYTSMPILIENYICWFQVSVYYLRLVQALDSQNYLCRVFPNVVLRYLLAFLSNLQQIPSRAVGNNQYKLIVGLKCVVQAHYERILNHGQYFSLHLNVGQ